MLKTPRLPASKDVKVSKCVLTLQTYGKEMAKSADTADSSHSFVFVLYNQNLLNLLDWNPFSYSSPASVHSEVKILRTLDHQCHLDFGDQNKGFWWFKFLEFI